MIKAEVIGAEAVQRAFDRFPDEMIKEMRKSLRRRTKPLLERVKSASPKTEWNDFATLKMKSKGGRVSSTIGFFGDQAKGIEWFKAYWLNYGTLAGRDPEHEFKYRVNANRRKKQRHGIDYENFFENAVKGQDEVVMAQVEKDLEQYVEQRNK